MKAYPKSKSILSPAILVLLITIMLLSTITGCGGSTSSSKSSQKLDQQEPILNFFDKVSLGMTKEQINSALGVAPTPNSSGIEGMFDYMDKNGTYGVLVTYNDQNLAYSKTLIYNKSHAVLATFTTKAVTKGQAESISMGMTYQQVTDLLGGEGVACSIGGLPNDYSKPSVIRRWANKDGSCIQVVFSPDGTVNNALFYNAD